MKFKMDDKTGKKFGHLTVIEVTDKPEHLKSHEYWWLCKCDCGNLKKVRGSCLTLNKVKSCGCFRKESMRKISKTHGKTNTMEFDLFYSAKKRAIKLNLNFNIDLDDIIIPEHCPILNIPLFKNNKSFPGDNSPSIDKVDPELGYIKGNIRVISFKANRMKQDNTKEQLEKLLLYIEGKI